MPWLDYGSFYEALFEESRHLPKAEESCSDAGSMHGWEVSTFCFYRSRFVAAFCQPSSLQEWCGWEADMYGYYLKRVRRQKIVCIGWKVITVCPQAGLIEYPPAANQHIAVFQKNRFWNFWELFPNNLVNKHKFGTTPISQRIEVMTYKWVEHSHV